MSGIPLVLMIAAAAIYDNGSAIAIISRAIAIVVWAITVIRIAGIIAAIRRPVIAARSDDAARQCG